MYNTVDCHKIFFVSLAQFFFPTMFELFYEFKLRITSFKVFAFALGIAHNQFRYGGPGEHVQA